MELGLVRYDATLASPLLQIPPHLSSISLAYTMSAVDPGSNPTITLSQAGSSELTKHEEFWFEDGSIVLVTNRTAFRIYRGLLATQSTVFEDMFATVTSPMMDETFEGCPVVRLSDSPYDLTHLLRILLPRTLTDRR